MYIANLGRFDAVSGMMILHHIEPFAEFAKRLENCIAPSGKAFFYENNAASRMLVWCRRNIVGKLWVPKYGDPEEFPLSADEVDELRKHIEVEQVYPEMLFFRLVSIYLLRGRAKAFFETLDSACYRRKFLLDYSYRQFLKMRKKAAPAP
jgi:hypothetical protein